MKITVKNLKNKKFQIEVKPQDTVADVKKIIETVRGSDVYPATEQLLIRRGKILNDATTLEENQVVENSTILVMLSKSKSSASGSSTTSVAPTIAEISEQAEVPPVAQAPVEGPSRNPPPPPLLSPSPSPRGDLNANPLDLNPQVPPSANLLDLLTQLTIDGSPRDHPPPSPPAPGPNSSRPYYFPQDMLEQIRVQQSHFMEYLEQHQVELYSLMDEHRERHRRILRHLTRLAPDYLFFQFSTEEIGAVLRIETLGFSRARIVNALLQSDMDEAEAIRYLRHLDYSESESESESEEV